MAVRSINLKMVIGRGDDAKRLRQSLWTTHAVLNNAVAEIERILLLLRGTRYRIGDDDDDVISEDAVHQEALAFARQVQSRNDKPNSGTDDEVLSAFRCLYVALVPSAEMDDSGKPLEGDAQNANSFASPMMDARSEGYQDIFEKIVNPTPDWVKKMAANASGWKLESEEWLKSDTAQQLLKRTGRKLTWIKKAQRRESWQEDFVKDQEKKRKEVSGVPTLIRRMKSELGLLPLFSPPIASRLAEDRAGLSKWDRLALRLAVGHLLSWESWNHRTAAEHAKVLERVTTQREQVNSFGELINDLREYEIDRHVKLKRIALANDDNPFRIGVRMIRGWDRVREAWLKSNGKSRLEILSDLQSKMSGKFGDPDLFRWLAAEGREHLWNQVDPVTSLARLNGLERFLDRKKAEALCTSPHARLHPQWVSYEAPGGTNLFNYGLENEGNKLRLKLPLLTYQNGRLADGVHAIPLAPSGQVVEPRLHAEGGRAQHLSYYSAHQNFSAKLGGSSLLFDRRHLENRADEILEQGDIGPVWFKLVVDVDTQAPADWLDGRGRPATPPAVHHFNTARANSSKHADKLEPGLRVLSIDLGLRTFAACSVFELVAGEPVKGLCFRADEESDLWAKHERSFLLSLPGERPSIAARLARNAAYDELNKVRHGLRRLKDILRLSVIEEPSQRRDDLQALLVALQDEKQATATLCDLELLHALSADVEKPLAEWDAEIRRIHKQAEKELASTVAKWRKQTRPRAANQIDRLQRRGYHGGKSAWMIEYLENVRRFLQGWSRHGRHYGQINRADRERQGTFAARLLDHINALKHDRIKSGTDLIVQAARGYVPIKPKGWVQKFKPCRLILFEDLARYRFRTDRPRRENTQLMRWSHREIVREAELQGEIYGTLVGTTGAGFSSRFHGRTGAPGCRTRVLSEQDLQSAGVQKYLELVAERFGLASNNFNVGARVPWDGGDDFVTLGDDHKPVVVHADLNAAQNLQRRFWNRHGEAYRISAVEIRHSDVAHWYPDRDGVRLRGALAQLIGSNGYARLTPAEDGDGYELESVGRAQWAKATTGQDLSGDDAGLDELEVQLTEAVAEDNFQRGDAKAVFFRDPSGHLVRRDRWYEAKEYWGRVTRQLVKALGLYEP